MCRKCDLDRRLKISGHNQLAPVRVGDIIKSLDLDAIYDDGLEYFSWRIKKQTFDAKPRHYLVIDSKSDHEDLIISIRIISPKGKLSGPVVPVLLEYKQHCVLPVERIQVIQEAALLSA